MSELENVDGFNERARSLSLGRSGRGYRARYWGYLLDKLQKLKDEICDFCERDQDILACKEVLLVIENYSKEFVALIEMIKLNDKFEKTPELCRSLSLSWEVRKPGSRPSRSVSRASLVSRGIPPRPVGTLVPPKQTCTVSVQTCLYGVFPSEDKVLPLAASQCKPVSNSGSRPLAKNSQLPFATVKCALLGRSNNQKLVATPSKRSLMTPMSTQPKRPLTPSPTSIVKRPVLSVKVCSPSVKQTTSSLLRRSSTILSVDFPKNNLVTQQPPNAAAKLSESTSSLSSSTSSKSWAETVKCGPGKVLTAGNNCVSLCIEDSSKQTGDDGWQVVSHHKVKAKSQSPSVLRSPSVPEFVCKRSSLSPSVSNLCQTLKIDTCEKNVSNSIASPKDEISALESRCMGSLQRCHTTMSAAELKDEISSTNQALCFNRKNFSKTSSLKQPNKVAPRTLPIRPTFSKLINKDLFINSKYLTKNHRLPCDRLLPHKAVTACHTEKNCFADLSHSKNFYLNEPITKATSTRERRACSPKRNCLAPLSLEASKGLVRPIDTRDDANESSVLSSELLKCDHISDSQVCNSDKSLLTETALDADVATEQIAAAIWINKQGLSLADQVEFLDQIEHRVPGRATKVHEKLSSPRKGVTEETLKRQEQRQAKAQEHRDRLKEERAQNYREILRKVEEHRAAKEEESKTILQRAKERQSKADKNREEQLRKKVQKAHDEKEKVQEIAFINTLEAQNKRHDIFEREKESDLRIQERQKKHQQRLEEKAAREAAAEERRKALEEEWQLKVNEILEKRADRDRKLQQQQQEKEAKRQVISKINELVREKVNAPGCTPYETKKMCSACNVLITSEVYLLSHLKSSKHQEAMLREQESYDTLSEDLHSYSLKYIVDAPVDEKMIAETESLKKHLKAIQKKRCRKLKQKILLKIKLHESQLNETSSIDRRKLSKCRFSKQLRDLSRLLEQQKEVKGVWATDACNVLERSLGDIERLAGKSPENHQNLADELSTKEYLRLLIEVIALCQRNSANVHNVIPSRTFARACRLLGLAIECSGRAGCGTGAPVKMHSFCEASGSSKPSLKDSCGAAGGPGLAAHQLVCGSGALVIVECLQHMLSLLVPDDNPAPARAPVLGCPFTSHLFELLHILCDRITKACKDCEACPSAAPATTLELDAYSNAASSHSGDREASRLVDLISYAISTGIIDKLTYFFTYIQRPHDIESSFVSDCILHGLRLVASFVRFIATAGLRFGAAVSAASTNLCTNANSARLSSATQQNNKHGTFVRIQDCSHPRRRKEQQKHEASKRFVSQQLQISSPSAVRDVDANNCNMIQCYIGASTQIITSNRDDSGAKGQLGHGETVTVVPLSQDNTATNHVSYITSSPTLTGTENYSCTCPSTTSISADIVTFNKSGTLVGRQPITASGTSSCESTPCDVVTDCGTQLLVSLRRTDVMGVVALLYSTLLCQGSSSSGLVTSGVFTSKNNGSVARRFRAPNGSRINKDHQLVMQHRMTQRQLSVTIAGCHLLSALAAADLASFQEVLGREGISLQVRHICSHLLGYCSQYAADNCDNKSGGLNVCVAPGNGMANRERVSDDGVDERQLLHQILLLVGFFAVNNSDNQDVIHAGVQPTVLQLLCKLPFDYFCDNKLRDILLPTLLACCCSNEQNTLLLREEVSPVMLLTYLEEKVEETSNLQSQPVKKEQQTQLCKARSLSSGSSAYTNTLSETWEFSKRFPRHLWNPAIEFLRASGLN